MGYAILSIEKVKAFHQMQKKMAHNFRQYDVPNADEKKRDLNKELIKLEAANYEEAFHRIISQSEYHKKKKVRKDAVLAIEVMMTYSSNHKDKSFNVEKWEEESTRWIQGHFGKDNVISAVVHHDETVPHIHAMVVPMHEDRLSANHYTQNKYVLSAMQDSYAERMIPLGLERGTKGSIAKRKDIKKFYTYMNRVLQRELPYPEPREKIMDYRDRANEEYRVATSKVLYLEETLEREKTRASSISLTERLDFEKEKTDFKKENAEIIAKVEKYKVLERTFPDYSAEEVVTTLAKADEFVEENPQHIEDVNYVLQYINYLAHWNNEREMKKKEQKKEREKDSPERERTR